MRHWTVEYILTAAVKIDIMAWNATSTRFTFFCTPTAQHRPLFCINLLHTLQSSQLYGSAGSIDGIGWSCNVPWRCNTYSRCSADSSGGLSFKSSE